MATVTERHGSPSVTLGFGGVAKAARREYIITDCESFDSAVSAALANIPQAMLSNALYLDSLEVSVEAECGDAASNVYAAVANYVNLETAPADNRTKPEPGDPGEQVIIEYDTTGGTRHIQTSLETVGKYKASGFPAIPQTNQLIGYHLKDGRVDGCDIVVPLCKYTERHYVKKDKVTANYLKNIYERTGTVNNAAWRAWQAGEVLFLGAVVRTYNKNGDYEVTFNFAIERNTTINLPNIVGISKKGHEYLWVMYEDVDDTDSKVVVPKPIAAFVERVYNSSDFSVLGA